MRVVLDTSYSHLLELANFSNIHILTASDLLKQLDKQESRLAQYSNWASLSIQFLSSGFSFTRLGQFQLLRNRLNHLFILDQFLGLV